MGNCPCFYHVSYKLCDPSPKLLRKSLSMSVEKKLCKCYFYNINTKQEDNKVENGHCLDMHVLINRHLYGTCHHCMSREMCL